MREPARKFLAPNGRIAGKPLRELHDGGDPPEVVARIAEATSLCDEPEMPSKATVDAHAELARTYDRLRYCAELEQARKTRQMLSIEARMADVQRRAKLRGANVSGEMHVVKKMLDRARNGGRKDPPAAFERIERIEYRLDWRPDLEDVA